MDWFLAMHSPRETSNPETPFFVHCDKQHLNLTTLRAKLCVEVFSETHVEMILQVLHSTQNR